MDHVSAPSNRGGAHQPGPKTATPHVSWSTSLHPNSNDIPSATKRVGIHPAIFQCTLCPKRFTRAYNLRSHLRTHTDERPFVCTVCGKAFARQHDRKRHEGLHSGEKKFVCKGELRNGGQWGCGRRFARADALERHFGSETGRICIKPAVQEGSFKGVVDGSSSPRGPERPELRARTELTAVSYTISRDGTDERKVHAERLCALDGGYRARHCKKKSEREERGDLDRHQLPRLKPRGLERMESPFLLQSFGQSGISGTTNSEKVTLDQSAGVGRTVRSYAPVGGSGLGPWPTSSDLSERFEPIDEHYPRPDKINTTATSPRATRSRYSSPPPVPFEVEKSRPGPENLNRLPSRSSFYSPQSPTMSLSISTTPERTPSLGRERDHPLAPTKTPPPSDPDSAPSSPKQSGRLRDYLDRRGVPMFGAAGGIHKSLPSLGLRLSNELPVKGGAPFSRQTPVFSRAPPFLDVSAKHIEKSWPK